MAVSRRRNPSYGINNPLQSNAPEPIVAQRAPTAADIAPLSTLWICEPTNAYYVLTSPGVWTAQSTGSATQASLEITGGSGTVLTVDAGGNTSLGGALAVSGASTLSGALTVNSAASAISIGTDAVAKTITIGNSTGATAVDLNSGSGGIGIGSLGVAQPIIVGNNTGASSVTILGGTAGAGFIDIGNAAHEVPIVIGNNTTGTSLGLFTDVTIPVSINSFLSVNGVYILTGAGSPAGTVTAPQGSLYLNTTGSSTSTRAYINTTGSTVWTAVTTAA